LEPDLEDPPETLAAQPARGEQARKNASRQENPVLISIEWRFEALISSGKSPIRKTERPSLDFHGAELT
jgi:hypothetical protein